MRGDHFLEDKKGKGKQEFFLIRKEALAHLRSHKIASTLKKIRYQLETLSWPASQISE